MPCEARIVASCFTGDHEQAGNEICLKPVLTPTIFLDVTDGDLGGVIGWGSRWYRRDILCPVVAVVGGNLQMACYSKARRHVKTIHHGSIDRKAGGIIEYTML